jgi:hypothetical protein
VADGVREIHQPILEGPPWDIGYKPEAEGDVGRPPSLEGRLDQVGLGRVGAGNRAVETVPEWLNRRLAPPQRTRASYWLRPEQLPASLRQEIDQHLHRLEYPDPFLGDGRRALAPTTIAQFRILFITLASALVAVGTSLEELTSLASLLQPDRLERALRFLHARAGERVTPQIYQMAYRVRKIAAHVGLSQPELARIDRILASVKREFPAEPGLTEKNRRLLGHLDDPAFVDRLLKFPARLVQVANATTCDRYAASCARDALATELLLTCSMRVGNLADLRVGESIRRFGQGRTARWVIEIPAEKVKNGQPLRYTLLP